MTLSNSKFNDDKNLLTAYIPWILILLICLLLQSVYSPESLRIDRNVAISRQWMNLFACHFIHLDWSHWFANMSGLLVIMFVFAKTIRPSLILLVLCVSSLSISLSFLEYASDFKTYVGFSGVLHGLFIFATLLTVRKEPVLAKVFLGFIALKLGYELIFGALPLHSNYVLTWTPAHLVGVATGLVLAAIVCFYNKLHLTR